MINLIPFLKTCPCQEYFGDAVSEQVTAMLRHFYPDITEEQCSLFLSLIPDRTVSMAQLQGLMLMHKDDLDLLEGGVRELHLT